MEYRLCEKFSWTLHELYSHPWNKIDVFLKIMSIEGQHSKQRQKEESLKLKQTKKYASRR